MSSISCCIDIGEGVPQIHSAICPPPAAGDAAVASIGQSTRPRPRAPPCTVRGRVTIAQQQPSTPLTSKPSSLFRKTRAARRTWSASSACLVGGVVDTRLRDCVSIVNCCCKPGRTVGQVHLLTASPANKRVAIWSSITIAIMYATANLGTVAGDVENRGQAGMQHERRSTPPHSTDEPSPPHTSSR